MNDLPVGAYKKDISQKEILSCDKCKAEADLLYHIPNLKGGEDRVCEGCYKKYWSERGYRV